MNPSIQSPVSAPRPRLCSLLAALFLLCFPCLLAAQTASPITLSGQVFDPTGALVPGATVTLVQATTTLKAASDGEGRYQIRGIATGIWQLTVDAPGFSPLIVKDLSLTVSRQLNLSLRLVSARQQVTVTTDSSGLSVSNADNVNATVIEGADLDALSDDPDQLRNELMALAGPAAGPDGGQIYVDGFTSNQLPPKSSILQVRVNQNPFSAENDRVGYGRIDIITRPSASKFGGHARYSFVSSALDTSNPLVTTQPGYFYYSFAGDATGPLAKNASWFLAGNYWQRQRQVVVNAVDPNDLSSRIAQAFPSPYSTLAFLPRVDFQLGNQVFSVRGSFFRTHVTGGGVGSLSLPQQGFSDITEDNVVAIRDFAVLSPYLVNELGIQWERGRDDQMPVSTAPSVNVQGAFVTGGSSAGRSADHEDFIELHDYMTATHALHVFRFGVRLRSFHDTSYSTAGANGSYTFASLDAYQAKTPSQYTVNLIRTPTTRILAMDAHLFFQDEWRARPNVSVGYGLRVQGQSRQHHPVDFAPRLAVTWAPHNDGHTAPRYALHFGAGLFYSGLGLGNMLQTIRQNGSNQQTYVIKDPTFYDPGVTVPPSEVSGAGSASAPSLYTLDQHFHTATSLQAGAGVDRALGKATALNVSYLFSQGTHQFLTDLVTAPQFDSATYTLAGGPPSLYNYQFQAGGFFRQHQLIFTARTRLQHLSLSGTYTFNHARGDSQGAGSIPSDSHNPGLDYGRTSFGISNQLQAVGSWALPHGFAASTIFFAQSGTPFNITTGSDLTGNSAYNARPTYGTCGAPGVTADTGFGCLDTDPTGKGERIVPFNLGTGPANMIMNLTVAKTIGVGPRLKRPAAPDAVASAVAAAQGNSVRPGQVGQGAAAAAPLAPRRFSLNLVAGVTNLFNIVNRSAPVGVLSSPLFGQSTALAGGAFSSPSPGNRTFYLNSMLTF